jgi:peptidoglycan/xylan/chitin deacetylase (PgdA/CDA1 family)
MRAFTQSIQRDHPIPILMYHRVAKRQVPRFESDTVTTRSFTAQMLWLAVAGYSTVSLDDLINSRMGGPPLPDRSVVITFDDGYQECIELAVPIMQSHKFRATFFLIAGLVGQRSSWLRRTRGFDLPLFDWEAARQLLDIGFHCGAHSLTHAHLAKLDTNACKVELAESKRVLEDHLGREVRNMAYPYGSYDERVRELTLEAGYRSACSIRKGLSGWEDDPLALHRVPVMGQDTLADFVFRLRTAQSTRETLVGLMQRNLSPRMYDALRWTWRRLHGSGVPQVRSKIRS